MVEITYIGLARNEMEVNAALCLATQVFRSEIVSPDEVIIKRNLMSVHNTLSEKDVVVMINDNNEVCGTCFLIDRFFFKKSEKLKGTYLTSICISAAYRGMGKSRNLMEYAIRECEKRGSIFAILIARKAVDHYYNKLQFWGISQYSKIQISNLTLKSSKNKYIVKSIQEKDIKRVNQIFEITYTDLYGSCERNEIYWNFIIWKVQLQKIKFDVLWLDETIVGYVIYSESTIFECAADSGVYYLDLLKSIQVNYPAMDKIELHASEKHPIVKELDYVDFTISIRQCSYGGHMARVINPDRLIKILEQELDAVFSNAVVDNISFSIDGVDIISQNGKTSICINSSPYDYRTTCLLMGAKQLSMSYPYFSFPSFNIPLLDQA